MSNKHKLWFSRKVFENVSGSFRINLKMQVYLQVYIGNCNFPRFEANHKKHYSIFFRLYYVYSNTIFYLKCKKH